MIELEVGPSLEGERIDRAVALLTGVTRSRAAALVAEGAVTLSGEIVTMRARRVRGGELLAISAEIIPEPEPAPPEPEASVDFDLVYGDEALLVVDKPAGLVVHPGAGNATGTLVAGLLARFPDLAVDGNGERARPGIVHRLDKSTSGLLVVARTPSAFASLVGQLARREMGRTYTALVLGTLAADAGTIDVPIGRSSRDRTRMAVEPSGRAALTRYQVERRFALPLPTTLLTARLETGRTHQIRVHLAAIGHPVAGDRTYRGATRLAGLGRPFLHARRLELIHPTSGERLSFDSPLPDDLEAVLAGLSEAQDLRLR